MENIEKQLTVFKGQYEGIRSEVSKYIVGQDEIIEQVLIAILSEGNVLLEGVPGLGKTELIKTMGKVLDLEFSRIQFTPDLMPADVVGTNIVQHDEDGRTACSFQAGPIFGNLILADEINRATPKTQSAMLEAMQEKTVSVGTETHQLGRPFFVLATQNPIEMEGTYPIPEAQMDRFIFKLNIKFPDQHVLKEIINITTTTQSSVPEVQGSADGLLDMIQSAKRVLIADPVMDYATKLIVNTHPDREESPEFIRRYVRYGASPRGAQALIKSARVRALINGRYNVAFEDIDAVAYPALRHRIIMNFEGLSEGMTADHIIKELIVSTR